jgi:hypothetical protein
VFSQTSVNCLISAYITSTLHEAGITAKKTVTLINSCISIWPWIIGVVWAVLTSRLRRRAVFLIGTSLRFIIFVAWTIAQALYDITGVMRVGSAVITLIFLYNAAYSFS